MASYLLAMYAAAALVGFVSDLLWPLPSTRGWNRSRRIGHAVLAGLTWLPLVGIALVIVGLYGAGVAAALVVGRLWRI